MYQSATNDFVYFNKEFGRSVSVSGALEGEWSNDTKHLADCTCSTFTCTIYPIYSNSSCATINFVPRLIRPCCATTIQGQLLLEGSYYSNVVVASSTGSPNTSSLRDPLTTISKFEM